MSFAVKSNQNLQLVGEVCLILAYTIVVLLIPSKRLPDYIVFVIPMAFLVSLIGLILVNKSEESRHITWSGLLLLLLIALNVVSYTWAFDNSSVWYKSSIWVLLGYIYFSSRSIDIKYLHHRIWRMCFQFTFILNMMLVSYYLISAAQGWNKITYYQINNCFAFFGCNANYISSLLTLQGLLFLMSLDSHERGRLGDVLKGVTSVLGVFLILIFNSRATMLVVLAITIHYIITHQKAKRKVLIKFFLSSAVTVLLLVLSVDNLNHFIEIYNPLPSILQTSSDDRLMLWQNSLRLFTDYFPMGVGAGNWSLLYNQYDSKLFNTTQYVHAHNLLFETLSEIGLLGGLNLIAFLVFTYLSSIKYSNPYIKYILVTYIILSSFYGVVYLHKTIITPHQIIWMVAIGILMQKEEKKWISFKYVYIFKYLLFVIGLSWITFVSYRTNQWNSLTQHMIAKETDAALTQINKISNVPIYPNPFRSSRGFYKSNLLWQKGKKVEAIEEHEKLINRYPYDYSMWKFLGDKYFGNRDDKKAFTAWNKAVDLNPNDPNILLTYIDRRLQNRNLDILDAKQKMSNLEHNFIAKYEKYYDPDRPSSTDPRIHQINKNNCATYDQYLMVKEKLQKLSVQ